MTSRLEKLEKLKDHPMIGKDFKRLKQGELEEITAFIEKHADLDDNAYMAACNRFKLDQPKNKNYPLQWSILIQCVEPKIKPRRA